MDNDAANELEQVPVIMNFEGQFPRMSDLDREYLKSKGRIRKYDKHWPVIHQNHDADAVYIVNRGEVQVYCEINEERTLLSRLGPGSVFGELGVLTKIPRTASVITLDDCEFSVLTRSQFFACLKERPTIALSLISQIVGLVQDLTEKLNINALDAYQRLRYYLYRLAKETPDGLVVSPWSQEQLAQLINCRRETISIKFRELRKGGFIKCDRKSGKIFILKPLPERF